MTVGLAMLTGAAAGVLAYVDWPALMRSRPSQVGSSQMEAPQVGSPSASVPREAPAPPQSPSAPSQEVERSAPDAPAAAATFIPSFDIVRVTPQGSAVIAGRAEPRARVTVFDGDRKLGETTADGHGEFVLVPERRMTAGARELTLSARDGAGHEVRGTDRVVILVPDQTAAPASTAAATRPLPVGETGRAGPDRAVAPTAPLADTTLPGTASGSGGQQAGGVAPPVAAASPAPAPAAAPIALLVPQDPRAPSRLLQAPKPAVVDPSRPLSLDTVDYDSQGEIRFTGSARPTGPVRVYVDNKPVADASVGGTGSWTVTPAERVAPGVHQLRVDQLASNGTVQNRVEMPFERTDLPAQALPPDRLVVQPGANLWRIARQTYGQGARYTVIYVANKEQIRDPKRIYPGQVLTLPPKP